MDFVEGGEGGGEGGGGVHLVDMVVAGLSDDKMQHWVSFYMELLLQPRVLTQLTPVNPHPLLLPYRLNQMLQLPILLVARLTVFVGEEHSHHICRMGLRQ